MLFFIFLTLGPLLLGATGLAVSPVVLYIDQSWESMFVFLLNVNERARFCHSLSGRQHNSYTYIINKFTMLASRCS